MTELRDAGRMFRSSPGMRWIFDDRLKAVIEDPRNRSPSAVKRSADYHRKWFLNCLINVALFSMAPFVVASAESLALPDGGSPTEIQSAIFFLLDAMTWLGAALGIGTAVMAAIFWEACRVDCWLLEVGLAVVEEIHSDYETR